MFVCEKCGKEYSKANRLGNHQKTCLKTPEQLAAEFWENVEKRSPTDCWNWTGNLAGGKYIRGVGFPPDKGYGQFTFNSKKVSAHRFAFEITNGPIQDGLWVLHQCDNPRCCNPAHLFLGDCQANHDDMARKGRSTATISAEIVLAVLENRSGGMSYDSIAKLLKISKSAVAHIVKGRTRKHLRDNHENWQESSGSGDGTGSSEPIEA